MLQFGLANEIEFYDYKVNPNEVSSWNRYPTEEDPSRKYKFTSIEFNLSTDLKITSRATYSLLDWLGDMGGLVDAFKLLVSLLL